MARINKKNQKVKDYIISIIKGKRFTEDAYGNWKSEDGKTQYKFQSTSYRVERLIDTKPARWTKVSGAYYKNVKVI